MAVENPLPGTWLLPLVVEALGDDFALLGGAWFSGARVADHVERARAVWAFAAASQEKARALIADVQAETGGRVIALIPGKHPDWPAEDGEAIRRLLQGLPPKDAVLGLLLSAEAPACAGGCAGCCATKGACPTLYARQCPKNEADAAACPAPPGSNTDSL